MPALTLKLAHVLLLQLRATHCGWPHRRSKGAQHLRINAIGLGQNSRRPRELPHPVGLHQTNFDLRPSKGLDQSSFILVARFTNHLHRRTDLFSPLDQLPMAKPFATSNAGRAGLVAPSMCFLGSEYLNRLVTTAHRGFPRLGGRALRSPTRTSRSF
jgi:hypothetical protein